MTNTYGRHTTHVDGENFNAVEWNKLLDYVTYATYALALTATAGWGSDEIGRHILVSGEGKWYYWNGSSLTGFPSVGGSGAPTDATYVTISAELGLSAETLHSAITNQSYLHIPKYHKTSHQDGGADELAVTGLSGLLADEQNAGKIKAKIVDDTAIGNGKLLGYNSATGKIEYYTVGTGSGDMLKAVYDTDNDARVNLAVDSDTIDGSHASAFASTAHKNTHKTGGSDALVVADLLDSVGRVIVAKSGATIGTRRTVDLIPGTGVTLTMTDVPASEKVTVQIDTTASTEPHNILSTQHLDTIIETPVDGDILQYVTGITFGYMEIGTSQLNRLANTKTACKFTLTENGTVTKITAYVGTPGSPVTTKCGIYSDNAGAPNALLGTTVEVAIPAADGWRAFTFTTPVALSAGTYWLAIIYPEVIHVRASVGDTNQFANNFDAYADGFADPFGTPTLSAYKFSIYATCGSTKWVKKKSKRGTATVANNGTIAHGFGLTPSTVFLTANAVQPYALAYEVNATNITVHHSAAAMLTVSYWVVE